MEMAHDEIFAAQQCPFGPRMTMHETNGTPQDDSFRFCYFDDRRHECFQIAVMIAWDHLDIRNDLDEILKEFGYIPPLFKLNFRNRMFDVPEKD